MISVAGSLGMTFTAGPPPCIAVHNMDEEEFIFAPASIKALVDAVDAVQGAFSGGFEWSLALTRLSSIMGEYEDAFVIPTDGSAASGMRNEGAFVCRILLRLLTYTLDVMGHRNGPMSDLGQQSVWTGRLWPQLDRVSATP